MSAYTRELRDAIFHARNARASLERAQAKAPEAHKRALDVLLGGLSKVIVWTARMARMSERQGRMRV